MPTALRDSRVAAARGSVANPREGGDGAATGDGPGLPALQQAVLRRIEGIVAALAEDAVAGRVPTLRFLSRASWANAACDPDAGYMRLADDAAQYTAVSMATPEQTKRFAIAVRVLAHIYHLVRTGTHATKRDIYYSDTEFFKEQLAVNDAVADIACLLCTPRNVLNVGATCRGVVAGRLHYREGGREVDVAAFGSAGRSITGEVVSSCAFRTPCSCVIVVEKDASFVRLLNDNAPERLNAVLVTGRGYPCLSTRMFLRRMYDEIGSTVPFYIVADADPHGMHIVATYCLGSRGLLLENPHLAVPALRWIGLTLEDAERFGVPQSAFLSWEKTDEAKARSLLQHPGISRLRPQWRGVVESAMRRRQKAELQCLAAVSIDCLARTYLPAKLAEGSWL